MIKRVVGLGVMVAVLLGLLMVPGLLAIYGAEAAPAAQNIPCYREQGGSKVVAGSGCEYEFQSGSTLDIQSGTSLEASAGVDLNGGILTYDADGDTTAVASTDDVVTVTIGTAAGLYNVITGNLKVGDGTPSVTQDGEDAYIEGQLEVDGEAQFDGAVDANSTMSVAGDITLENGETIGNATDGLIGLGGGLLLSTTTVTVTDGQTITPTTYSVYNLDSAGAVTITLAACTEGQWLVLAGDDANDITIADSNIRTDDGNAAVVNQYDMFIGVCIDAEWLQVANPTDS